MELRVFHDGGRMVETHRLIVQQSSGESAKVVALQPRAGISDQGKAGGVGFRKTIKRKRSDRENDLFLRFLRDAVPSHACAQASLDFFHARLRALESHGA